MVLRFKENPVSETLTKGPEHVNKTHPVGENIPVKKASTTPGMAVKKQDPCYKSLQSKGTIPEAHETANKMLLKKKVMAVKKLTAVQKTGGMTTKMGENINKPGAVNKMAPAKTESRKKITEVKTVVPVVRAMAEKIDSLSANKTEEIICPAKVEPREEDKKPSPTTECKKQSPAKTLPMETVHENKVCVKFADDSINKEKKPVIDRSGNEAGDDLKNVPGLNINNSLYVKIFFTDRPPKGTLTEFISKYHLESFKRIDDGVNLFAAKLNNMDDFEHICNLKEVYCGQVKVTVKPCYKYSSHPPKSKTTTTTGSGDDQNKCEEIQEKNTSNDNLKKEKTCIETDKEKSVNKSINKIEKSEKSLKYQEINRGCSVNTSDTSSFEPDNSSKETKSVQNINIKAAGNESNINMKKDDGIKDKIEFDNKSGSVNANTLPTISTDNKKGPTGNKLDSKCTTESKGTKVNIKHEQRKIVTKVQKGIKSYFNENIDEISEHTFEGDDEMDDKDILALISEGIVLDECRDSEEEL